MHRLRIIIRKVLPGASALIATVCAGEQNSIFTPADARTPWQIIAPYFQPPSEFNDQFGSYRSPLQFADGRVVRTAAEWPVRRKEILDQWISLMGRWPPVLEKPQVQIVSEQKREDLIQRRMRLEIAPDQTGEGWLLLPQGKGPFPAVLVVYYEPETSIGISKETLRDFGYQLAKRGFVTLSIGTPGGNAWKPELGAARCQPLSFHAYVAVNCWQDGGSG